MSAGGASVRTVDRQHFADLYALLSRCFQRPDDDFVAAVRTGAFETTLQAHLDPFAVDVDAPPEEPDDLWTAYMRTFEAYEGAYAPPVESVYEEWWDGNERELLSGPPAREMQRRYDAADITHPSPYPADHLALLLEYGSVLLEEDAVEAYLIFHEEHFDWIGAFRGRIAETGDEPFYSWAVETLATVLDLTRTELQAHG